MTEAEEFRRIYNLDVVPIPTHRDDPRGLRRPGVQDEDAKFKAVVDEIRSCTQAGRPVLVGTVSIEKSENLSALLEARGVPHEVLNAKQHEREAGIIAQAGRSGAVTIATNMAGRGVDILLGGNPAGSRPTRSSSRDLNPEPSAGKEQDRRPARAEAEETLAEEDHVRVVEAGGLHIVGTERTRRAGSTTSCAAAPAARAIPARRASTSRSKTT